MKKLFDSLYLIGFLVFMLQLFSSFLSLEQPYSAEVNYSKVLMTGLKEQAFEILDKKCNVCHRKQNPFKVFSLKNMNKHAPKIYQQVFVKRKMPKGDKIKLTTEEYQLLKNWLKSQNTY